MLEIVVQHIFFSMLFEDPFCTKCNLMEFVRTHVILAPGACWGGAELQSVDQIPWIWGNPRDPGMESFFPVLGKKKNEN